MTSIRKHRIIRTGLYGEKTAKLTEFARYLCCLSVDVRRRGVGYDNDRYIPTGQYLLRYCSVEIETDNEMVFVLRDYPGENPYFKKECLNAPDEYLRGLIGQYLNENIDFDCLGKFDGRKKSEIGCLIGMLRGDPDSDLDREYGGKLVEKIRGEKHDPFRTELEIRRKEEIRELELKMMADVLKTKKDCDRRIDELIERCERVFRERVLPSRDADCPPDLKDVLKDLENAPVSELIHRRDVKILEIRDERSKELRKLEEKYSEDLKTLNKTFDAML